MYIQSSDYESKHQLIEIDIFMSMSTTRNTSLSLMHLSLWLQRQIHRNWLWSSYIILIL